ncbi:AsnC family protein [uncultured Cohaesibacter sp.]|uniref:AsnC family protein n=1 Tax=uncultured Cohaesibacter sp. TaxID=1002546 RepID=UPI002AABD4A4|nr:AsnC family protein [uncultured Cohaesibacter sp.]
MSKALPGVLSEIAEVTDVNTALMIANVMGGGRAHIPPYASDDHWLTELVGLEKAKVICGYFRIITSDGRAVGIVIDVPLAKAWKRTSDTKRIDKGLLQGKTYDVIAREVGVSRMTVLRRSKKLRQMEQKPPDAQLDLFTH